MRIFELTKAFPAEERFGLTGQNRRSDSALDFAVDCGYITVEQHEELSARSEEIGKMLGRMIHYPGGFLVSMR